MVSGLGGGCIGIFAFVRRTVFCLTDTTIYRSRGE